MGLQVCKAGDQVIFHNLAMEDEHIMNLSLLQNEPQDGQISLFAVFDGHGGSEVSHFCKLNMQRILTSRTSFTEGKYEEALKETFIALDDLLLQEIDQDIVYTTGSTSIAVLVTRNHIYTANVGDSRAVLCRSGRAIPLSFDHKPFHKAEHDRIVNAGGFVQSGRVNGNLALSRALGDFEYKRNSEFPLHKQIVSGIPDIVVEERAERDEFVVIACDGIWDAMSNTDVVDFVRERKRKMKLDKVCEALIMQCVAPSYYHEPGGDNMTVIIVAFTNHKQV